MTPPVLTYDQAPRRRARAGLRLGAAALRPGLYPSSPVVPAYWWDGHPNFGDGLTPWLLPRYGVVPVHRVPARAEMVGVGSIIKHMPEDFAGVVWGAGLMHDADRPLPRATVLAVRGELSRRRISAPQGVALGDPGLLVARHIRRPRVRWRVGLVPHGHHRTHPSILALAARYPDEVHVVNVHDRTGRAIREIAACAAVVSSSLHGIVTADSFGIPAAWTTFDPGLPGGEFKFRDHETVVGDDRFLVLDESSSIEELLADPGGSQGGRARPRPPRGPRTGERRRRRPRTFGRTAQAALRGPRGSASPGPRPAAEVMSRPSCGGSALLRSRMRHQQAASRAARGEDDRG